MTSTLVARLRLRHPGAFDELYREYGPRVWRFLAHLARGRERAEDLYQETWLAAARHAHELREDTDLLPWLFTIARNKHKNQLRAGAYDARRRERAGTEPRPEAPLPDDEVDAKTRARRVEAVLAAMPDAYREVLVLAGVEGLEAAQIGAVLDLTPEAVRKRLSRARGELQRLVSEDSKKGAAR